MVGKRRAQRFTALSWVLLLAACGGGGGSHAPLVPGTATTAAPQGTGHVTFSISVPAAAASAQAKRRAPAYVSPATKSAAISVDGVTTNIDLTSGSAGCNTDYAHGSISEIPVGLEPRGFLPQPNGMYFVEDAGGGVGLITGGNTYTDVSTGEYQEGLILGPDGDLWISHVYSNSIGHMTLGRQMLPDFSGMPADQLGMVLASDNTVWFTTFTGTPNTFVYHVGSDGTYVPGDTIALQYSAHLLVSRPDGSIWVTETNGLIGAIARIAKVNGTWTLTNEFPVTTASPNSIANGSDGAVWFTDSVNKVYRISNDGSTITAMGTLTDTSGVDITTGPDGAIWVPENASNKIGRVTTGGAVTEYAIPTANSQPWSVAAGDDGAIYFSERNTNNVGRIQFPTACTSTATVPIGSGTVTVTAYDATGGASGGGHALSTQTIPVTILANTTTVVNFVLNGIATSAAMVVPAAYANCSSSGSVPIALEAFDASGNIITGPGVYADASGNPLTFTLATSDTSGKSTFANAAVTSPSSASPVLTWSGGVLNYQTLTATASGGTFAGTIAPVNVSNNC